MKIVLFSFKMAINTAGSAQKIRVGRVSGNTAIFRPYIYLRNKETQHILWVTKTCFVMQVCGITERLI